MVLKVINKSDKDICLPWGQWNYKIPVGGELVNIPTDVVEAMKERYKVEVVPAGELAAPSVVDSIPEVPKGEEIENPVEQPIEDIKVKRGRPKKIA